MIKQVILFSSQIYILLQLFVTCMIQMDFSFYCVYVCRFVYQMVNCSAMSQSTAVANESAMYVGWFGYVVSMFSIYLPVFTKIPFIPTFIAPNISSLISFTRTVHEMKNHMKLKLILRACVCVCTFVRTCEKKIQLFFLSVWEFGIFLSFFEFSFYVLQLLWKSFLGFRLKRKFLNGTSDSRKIVSSL